MDGCDHKTHQCLHLLFGPVPVLGREGVKRQVAQSQLRHRIHDLVHRGHTFLVAIAPRLALCFCPTAVSIHDDGHVLRQSAFIYIIYQRHLSIRLIFYMFRIVASPASFSKIIRNGEQQKRIPIFIFQCAAANPIRIIQHIFPFEAIAQCLSDRELTT